MQKQNKRPAVEEYTATRDVWVKGGLVRKGGKVCLTERAARYHVLDGALKPVLKAVQTPAEGPKKRARKSDNPPAETAEG